MKEKGKEMVRVVLKDVRSTAVSRKTRTPVRTHLVR